MWIHDEPYDTIFSLYDPMPMLIDGQLLSLLEKQQEHDHMDIHGSEEHNQ